MIQIPRSCALHVLNITIYIFLSCLVAYLTLGSIALGDMADIMPMDDIMDEFVLAFKPVEDDVLAAIFSMLSDLELVLELSLSSSCYKKKEAR